MKKNADTESPEAKLSGKGPGRFVLPVIAVIFLAVMIIRLNYLLGKGRKAYTQYSFRVTRKLVDTVHRAKAALQKDGVKAFGALEKMKSKQLGMYVYVYRSSDALCLYHGQNKSLEGTRLDKFTDQLGKPLHKLIKKEISNPRNPHGWVHYYWHRPDALFLEWKSSCNLAVKMPDGTECYVGGGLTSLGAETEFARIAVKNAKHLVATEGEAALEKLLAPEGPFFFYDTAVFVLKKSGRSIIDPVLKKRYQRNLLEFKDAVKRYPFRHLLRKLKTASSAQIVLYAQSPTSMNYQKKTVYAENCKMSGEDVIVGTVIDSPKSVWLH